MRVCGCGEEDLELALVTHGSWKVLCRKCGALGRRGSSVDAAVKNWNDGRLERREGWFQSEECRRDGINLGRRIAGIPDLPPEGIAEIKKERV